MSDSLDQPLENLTSNQLNKIIDHEILERIENNSNKQEIHEELNTFFKGRYKTRIKDRLNLFTTKEDQLKLYGLRNTLIFILILSACISVFLFYTYENEKYVGPDYASIALQVLFSSYLIIGILNFKRNAFSRIQLLNFIKIAFIGLSILSHRFPDLTVLYLVLLVGMHFLIKRIKKIGFDFH